MNAATFVIFWAVISYSEWCGRTPKFRMSILPPSLRSCFLLSSFYIFSNDGTKAAAYLPSEQIDSLQIIEILPLTSVFERTIRHVYKSLLVWKGMFLVPDTL